MATCCSSTCATITGVTQCVIDASSPLFAAADALRLESVVTLTGTVAARSADTVNPKLATGEIELAIDEIEIQSQAEPLPFPVNSEADYPEEMRLAYRFLDLRRERVHANIMLRAQVIASIRRRMIAQGFSEFQTPILTASSPEGARDYLVPSRLHPGKFYALPQAPQQFKQLLMVAGFDRYFQIAPCFRDEASRADRSPGEFYQLDFEMSFVTQEDVFAAIEPVLRGIFEEFGGGRPVTPPPFPRIAYTDAMPTLRHRQARSAQPDRDARRDRAFSRLRVQGLRQSDRVGSRNPRLGDPGADRRQPRLLRPDELLGAIRRPAWAWLYFFPRWRGRAARWPAISGRNRPTPCAAISGSATATRCSLSAACRGNLCRLPAPPGCGSAGSLG